MNINKYHLTRVSPRIADQSAQFYRDSFANLNSGMEYIGNAFPGLYLRSISALAGVFSQGELLLMIESGNGVELSHLGAGVRFRKNVQLSAELEQLDKKYKVDLRALLNTLDNMTIFELAALELWVYIYWIRQSRGDWQAYANSNASGNGATLGCREGLEPVYLAAMMEYAKELL